MEVYMPFIMIQTAIQIVHRARSLHSRVRRKRMIRLRGTETRFECFVVWFEFREATIPIHTYTNTHADDCPSLQ